MPRSATPPNKESSTADKFPTIFAALTFGVSGPGVPHRVHSVVEALCVDGWMREFVKLDSCVEYYLDPPIGRVHT